MEAESAKIDAISERFYEFLKNNDTFGCEAMLLEGYDVSSVLSLIRRPVSDRIYLAPLLNVACIYRFPDIIRLLLKAGSNPNARDKMGYAPIHLTIYYWPHYLYVRNEENLLLRTGKMVLPDYLNILHEKSLSCLQLLCDFGADVNLRIDDGQGDTALHLAAKENFTACLDILIKFDVDLNANDNDGKTPLMVAADYDNVQILKELVIKGANINSKDRDEMTALHLVCRNHAPEYPSLPVIQFLLKHGADANAQNIYGNTPLHIAAAWGYEVIIDWLVAFGANPDILNRSRQTPLFLLLDTTPIGNKLFGIQKLLNESAQIYIRDINSTIPRMLNHELMIDLRTILETAASKPSSLQRFCRQTIRRSIGLQNLGQFLENLNFPEFLKNFIFFENINTF